VLLLSVGGSCSNDRYPFPPKTGFAGSRKLFDSLSLQNLVQRSERPKDCLLALMMHTHDAEGCVMMFS